MVDWSIVDHSLDVRLDRRLKRRAVSNQQCRNFCFKTLKNDKLNELDADYRRFFFESPKFEDSSDAIIEAEPVNFCFGNERNWTSRCNSVDEIDDPIYKMFLRHLTAEGKAYKLEIPSVNGMKMYVKYEEIEKPSSKNDESSKMPGRTTRILKNSSKKDVSESRVPLFEEECAKPMSHGVNGSSSTMANEGLSSAKHLSGYDFNSDIVDEDYMTFLTNFRYDGRRLIFSPVYGRSVVYEDDESISNSELVMKDTHPCKSRRVSFGREYVHPTMDVDSGNFLQSARSSNFRERLMKVLEKPYDQREYDFLLKEVSCRRSHVRYRELRSRALKPYTLESQAESYLLLYGDLAMKIQSVQYDCPRTLNLLRGFFFWLQNLSHEDNFQPWMDPSCLDVLPRS